MQYKYATIKGSYLLKIVPIKKGKEGKTKCVHTGMEGQFNLICCEIALASTLECDFFGLSNKKWAVNRI